MVQVIHNRALVELLLGFESGQSREASQLCLCQFMEVLGFEGKIYHAETSICLTLTSQQASFSLIWLPRESHYCPRLEEITEEALTGVSRASYVTIWRAFNAYCYTVWQLPLLYRQILEALSRGKNLQEIAVEVKLSLPSVKRYMGLIRELLGASTNPQTIVIAARKGWI
ncbi:hypothetical protein CSW98_09600 [Vibrio sp. HA2012]|uniref:hypothetical protein n=1 Tax=Vibrio sp. HA2012 TaxID=1971595 RepID=UPI000C2C6925|nr:hypothetical protein [Vibrio sp. HA2012]PJC86456.1 hypothetical protein CSW98_09600 [Vibrio sp. HA2012]